MTDSKMPAVERESVQTTVTSEGIPNVMVQQAEAAAAAAQNDDDDDEDRKHQGHWAQSRLSMDSLNTSVYASTVASVDTAGLTEAETITPDHPDRLPLATPVQTQSQAQSEKIHPDIPPPAYGDHYGMIEGGQDGLETQARVLNDGRVNINIDQHTRKLASILGPALRREAELAEDEEPPPAYIPPSLGGADGQPPPPPMNVVIQVVGSRGDVQPFVALGKVLKERYGHRVRLATHLTFRDFVVSNGLEFFNIGGDPAKLMAFMVKNPGLMPDISAIQEGEIGKRRLEVREMLRGCWRSCYEAGDGTGPAATDQSMQAWTADGMTVAEEEMNRPFVADAIVANPPSFAHIHVAEKLGIPLHIMFTMPYSPTQAFPHPLANIQSSNAASNLTNYISYILVELLTWQGLGDVINSFRNRDLGLEDIGTWSAQVLHRLKIPHTYCWSPALIPKPSDWRRHITVSGFYFLDAATGYTPAAELETFLKSGPPPVYIGFGSIVLDDPNSMTELIFEAVRRSGQRALVSQGWGGMGGEELDKPDDVLMLGNCPHDWLFEHVSCVVHHGGAGTTAIGIKAGKPTVIVPFFGDQPFWGAMVAKAGAGPEPIPHKELTAEKLAAAIEFCQRAQTQERARELGSKLAQENGSEKGAQTFHQFLKTDELRCSLAPSRVAVWRVKRTQVRLSALAACTLANANLIDFKNLKLYRPREYDTDPGPYDPISGGAESLIGTISGIMGGVMHMPMQQRKQRKSRREQDAAEASSSQTPSLEAGQISSNPAPTSEGDDTKAPASESATATSVRSGSSVRSAGSGTDTPATTTGSSFNLGESLAKLDHTIPSLHRPQSGEQRSTQQDNSQRPEGSRRKSSRAFNAARHLETVQNTGEGIAKILEAGLKSPMDFTSNLARGFHNAPKLYGDSTVRPKERVTGFGSGLKAAGRGFGLGMYDGITGLVTQPMQGLAKEGPSGFVKGIGKGIGGIVFKPGAAIFGIPGYTMKGIYKEMVNMLGSSVQNYIIAARTAQGYEQWNESLPQERDDIVKRYLRLQRDGIATPGSQRETPETLFEQPNLPATSSAPTAVRQADDDGDPDLPPYQLIGTIRAPQSAEVADTAETLHLQHPQQVGTIPASIRHTDEDDSDLQAAIRASMVQNSQPSHDVDDHEQHLSRALANSLAESHAAAHDDDLEKALKASLAEQKGKQIASTTRGGPSATSNTEDDLPAYDEQTAIPGLQPDQKTTAERREEDIVLEYIKKQSLLEKQHSTRANQSSSAAGPANEHDDDEDDVRRAIELSLQGSR